MISNPTRADLFRYADRVENALDAIKRGEALARTELHLASCAAASLANHFALPPGYALGQRVRRAIGRLFAFGG